MESPISYPCTMVSYLSFLMQLPSRPWPLEKSLMTRDFGRSLSPPASIVQVSYHHRTGSPCLFITVQLSPTPKPSHLNVSSRPLFLPCLRPKGPSMSPDYHSMSTHPQHLMNLRINLVYTPTFLRPFSNLRVLSHRLHARRYNDITRIIALFLSFRVVPGDLNVMLCNIVVCT